MIYFIDNTLVEIIYIKDFFIQINFLELFVLRFILSWIVFFEDLSCIYYHLGHFEEPA